MIAFSWFPSLIISYFSNACGLWFPVRFNLSMFSLKVRRSRSSHPEVVLAKGILKIYSKSTGEHLWRSAISIKILKQLYWKYTSAWVLFCKFAAYFQNIFSQEQLWTAASEGYWLWYKGKLPACFLQFLLNLLLI